MKYFGVVTNIWGDWSAQKLLQWHREKGGSIEAIHDVLKNELAAGVLPCGRFGANAAWFRLAAIAHNVLTTETAGAAAGSVAGPTQAAAVSVFERSRPCAQDRFAAGFGSVAPPRMAPSAAAVGRSRFTFQNPPESAFTACSLGEAMPVLGPPCEWAAQPCPLIALPRLALPAIMKNRPLGEFT